MAVMPMLQVCVAVLPIVVSGVHLEPFRPNPSQFCFSIGACDPALQRAQRDACASGKTDAALGARQSETRRDGRSCAIIGAKALARALGYALRAFA